MLPLLQPPPESSFYSTGATSSLLSFCQKEEGVTGRSLYYGSSKMNACKKISRKSLRKQPATKVTLKRLKEPHGNKLKTVAVNKNPKYTEFLACKSFPSRIKCEKLLGTSKQICTPRVQLLALKKANKAYLVGL